MSDPHKAAGQADHASATGEGAATASGDAASVEAHLTGNDAPTVHLAGSASGSANEEVRSARAIEEVTAIPRGGLPARPTSQPRTAVNSNDVQTPTASETSAAWSDGEAEATTSAEPVSDTRAGGGIRGWASRLGRGSAATAAADGEADGVAATATATAGSGGDSPDADGGFPGRPKRPVLAGAAMAGAILIAVPLLVMATGKDDDDKSEKVNSARSADTVLDDDGSKSGDFVAESPTPKKSKTTKEKEKETPKKTSSPAAEKAAAKPTPSPSHSAKAENKKRTAAKQAAAAANLPSVLTRVLIKNNTNGTCVDIPGLGSGPVNGPVHQSDCTNSSADNQVWNLENKYDSAGPGGVPLFLIRNNVDSHCLDLPGYGSVGNATKVQESICDGTTADNQLWWLDERAEGKFWIRNLANDNQCLDSYERDSDIRDLIIWPCAQENLNNHEWIFTRG
ncbi:RICIN domain-containing protein [Streptomyces sp. NPDC059679]|uniref:RICIN domain-containing protein n=1 Tax=Streptomyces sp. NPDC059679 TaxID=3346903 RepID=UPI003688A7F7